MNRRKTATEPGDQRVHAPKLLEDIEAAKPAGRSVSAHVRRVLQKDLDRRQALEAAVRFRAFIDAHPEEKAWLADWGDADLAVPPAHLPD